ncbi:MAG: HEAT repeat domain-containing protein, partial [Cyanobium sp.]
RVRKLTEFDLSYYYEDWNFEARKIVFSVRQSAVQELARAFKDDPDTLPILKSRAQSDEDSDVRQSAVQELVRGWRDDPDIQMLVQSL